MLIKLLWTEYHQVRKFSASVVFATVIFGLGLLYIRFGVGRPDEPHINLSVSIFFLITFYIIQLYVRRSLWKQLRLADLWPVALIFLLLVWPKPTWDPVNLFKVANVKPSDIKNIIHLPQKLDEQWLNDQQKAVTKYIKDNTKPSDKIFVLEPEPLYYYLTNRANPSRFYITWFADPQAYTDELLRDLKKDPPKYIIYSGPPGTDLSDTFPTPMRVPEVNDWIVKNYPTEITINQSVLRSK
jgi:hypothetical protein